MDITPSFPLISSPSPGTTRTGTPAAFLHPVDSLHGDLGIVGKEDVAVLLSKSGSTDELFGLVEQLKRLSVPIIAVTGAPDSVLARQASVVLDAAVKEEACPETLAPTASTTAALALGDALAVTLLEVKGFRREDFAALEVERSPAEDAVTREDTAGFDGDGAGVGIVAGKRRAGAGVDQEAGDARGVAGMKRGSISVAGVECE